MGGSRRSSVLSLMDFKGRDAGSMERSPARRSGTGTDIYRDDPALVEVQVVLPPETKITKDAAGQFLMSLGMSPGR